MSTFERPTIDNRAIMRVSDTETPGSIMRGFRRNLDSMIDIDWDYHCGRDQEFQMTYIVKYLTMKRALKYFNCSFDVDDVMEWTQQKSRPEISEQIERFLFGATYEEIQQSAIDWEEIQQRRLKAQIIAEQLHSKAETNSQISWLKSLT